VLGLVICSRAASSRLPNKALLHIENRSIIGHLVNQIKDLDIPIVVSVPFSDFSAYSKDETIPRNPNILIHQSEHDQDPLARKAQVAKQFGFTAVIRITHDKIFIDTDALKEAIDIFKKEKPDYLYPSGLIAGTNFEIISTKCLLEASSKFKNVEHISYAVRNVSQKTVNFTYDQNHYLDIIPNLLIDYEDDFKFMQVLLSQLGPDANLKDVIHLLQICNCDIMKINKKPILSIYTCAYNAEKTIHEAMTSVVDQIGFSNYEYILIDDHSTDSTFFKMAHKSVYEKNISYYRNQRNLELATSSNIALSKAKGKYIMRLDADDFFPNLEICEQMIKFIEQTKAEIIYPDNYFGSFDKIQKGSEHHHVGGALFDKNALNFIKFTDGLRGYEGYDLFLRAQNRLKISYFEKPAFFYTQRNDSMSKTNLKDREKIKGQIDATLKRN